MFDWDDANRAHIWRHRLLPSDAEEAMADQGQVTARGTLPGRRGARGYNREYRRRATSRGRLHCAERGLSRGYGVPRPPGPPETLFRGEPVTKKLIDSWRRFRPSPAKKRKSSGGRATNSPTASSMMLLLWSGTAEPGASAETGPRIGLRRRASIMPPAESRSACHAVSLAGSVSSQCTWCGLARARGINHRRRGGGSAAGRP